MTEVNFVLNTGDKIKFYSVCKGSAVKIFVTLFYLVLDIGDQELVSKYRIWYIVGTSLFYRLLVIGCSLGLPWICVFQTLFSPSPACYVLSGQALRPLLGQADADSCGRLPFPLLPSHMSAAHVFLLSFISLHIFR